MYTYKVLFNNVAYIALMSPLCYLFPNHTVCRCLRAGPSGPGTRSRPTWTSTLINWSCCSLSWPTIWWGDLDQPMEKATGNTPPQIAYVCYLTVTMDTTAQAQGHIPVYHSSGCQLFGCLHILWHLTNLYGEQTQTSRGSIKGNRASLYLHAMSYSIHLTWNEPLERSRSGWWQERKKTQTWTSIWSIEY